MKQNEKKKSSGNPYDAVFRTMITDSSRFAISLINEMFGKNIPRDAEMISYQNEMFLADNEERISDSNRQFGEDNIHYHTECESVAGDSGILVRLFEYGSKITFITGRLRFNEANTAPFPSMLVNLCGGGITKTKCYLVNREDINL